VGFIPGSLKTGIRGSQDEEVIAKLSAEWKKNPENVMNNMKVMHRELH